MCIKLLPFQQNIAGCGIREKQCLRRETFTEVFRREELVSVKEESVMGYLR